MTQFVGQRCGIENFDVILLLFVAYEIVTVVFGVGGTAAVAGAAVVDLSVENM